MTGQAPAAAVIPTSGESSSAPTAIRYVFVARDALPSFDASQVMYEAVFPRWINKRHVVMTSTNRRVIFAMYLAMLSTRCIGLYGPAKIGRVLAILSPWLQVRATASAMSHYRVAYVRLLLRTFEFWYFVVLNIVWIGSLGALLGDVRAILLPFFSIEFINMMFIDAYFRSSKPIIIVGVLTMIQLIALIAAVTFERIDGARNIAIIATSQRRLTSRDAVVYSATAILILITRMVYRRYEAMRQRRQANKLRVTSVMPAADTPPTAAHRLRVETATVYRCKLMIQQAGASRTALNQTKMSSRRPQEAGDEVIAMRLAPAKSIVFVPPKALRCGCQVLNPRACFMVCSIVSTTGTIASSSLLLAPASSALLRQVHVFVAFSSVAASFGLVLLCGRYYSLQLLRRWLTSFDAVILLMKVTVVHLCLCDMVRWHVGWCLVLLSSWLLWLWILLVDALPPISKQTLGISLRMTVLPLLLLSCGGQVFLALELVVWDKSNMHDRQLFHLNLKHGHVFELMTGTFALSRLLMVFVWTWRLVFRVALSKSDDELLLLSGAVEYDRPHRTRSRSGRAATHHRTP